MQISDWIASFAALFSAIAAVVSGFIAARWGKEFARAKDAQLEAKDAQISTLRLEVETLRELASPKLRESFVSMREQLEEYNESILEQLNEAKATIQKKDAEIERLKGRVTEDIFVKRLESERDELKARVASLESELQGTRSEQRRLEVERERLSDRQQAILLFLAEYVEEHGYPPSIREIGAAVGISSTSVVSYNLRKLEEKGFIVRDPDFGSPLVSPS